MVTAPDMPAGAQTEKPEQYSAAELNSRMLERRAAEAVIRGLPAVGEYAVKQAAFRDGKANCNDIVWWPKGSWKNQSPTANVNTHLYFFTSTRQDRPVVVELPPAVGDIYQVHRPS